MRKRLMLVGLLLVLVSFLAVPRDAAYAANPPTITAITPSSGPNGGGTVVTIYGTGFQPGAGTTFVSIGGVLSNTVNVLSPNQLTALTPAGNVGAVTVQVINPDGQSASTSALFSFSASTTNPTGNLWIAGINPGTGPIGQPIYITGSGFSPNVVIFFGDLMSEGVTWVSARYVVVYPPNGSGTVPVRAVNPDGTSATSPTTFTYTTSGSTSTTSVSISSVSPSPITAGSAVTIVGAGFQSGATVTFGGYPATNVSVITNTLITAVAPAGPTGLVELRVQNTNGAAGTFPGLSFTGGGTTTSIPGQPTVSSVSPSSGPSGTTVTISGGGFTSPATVTFGGVAATNVSVVSGNQITATVPANALGAVTVLVAGGTGAVGGLTNGFTYSTTVAQPTTFPSLMSVSPSSGATTGGATLTLTGSGFTTGATVTIGGVPATVLSVSPSQILVTTPAGPAGAVTVLVTNPGGAITGLANGFTYNAGTGTVTPTPATGTLTVTGVSPASGPSAGGTAIVINGSGFQSGATVTISGINVPGTLLSSAQIAATTPAVTGTGSVTVTVTNPSGASASLPSAFTYGGTSTGGTTTGGTSGGTTGGSTGSGGQVPGAGGASGPVPTGGGLFVFGGGTNEQLVAAAACKTANAAYWTTTATGEWIGYVPSVPIPAVNAAWNKLFATGIPAGTPIFARC